MEEEFVFYVAPERAFPQNAFGTPTAERIGAIYTAIEAVGTEVGRVRCTIDDFARAFELIGAAMGVDDNLAQGAVATSPHDYLDDDDPSWRMGYFDAETVGMVQDELPQHAAQLSALDRAPFPVPALRDQFLAACDEGSASGQAMVILHTAP